MLHRVSRLCKLLPPVLVREVRERYVGSAMGAFWALLQPLLTILLYWLVFSTILRTRVRYEERDIPFIAYLLSGLLPWFAVQEGIARAAPAIVEKREVIKKVLFPAELFPVSSVVSSFIFNGVGFLLFVSVYFVVCGGASAAQMAALVVLLAAAFAFTLGIGLLLSAFAVYVRDLLQVVGLGLTVLFFTSTILYPLDAVPERLRGVLLLNPVTGLAECLHAAVLHGRWPPAGPLVHVVAVAAVSLAAGAFAFGKLKRGFADVL